jgi:aldose sugar dehydrogenase
MKQPPCRLLGILFSILFFHGIQTNAQVVKDSTFNLFTMDTVAMNLSYPWEITYGPDDSLWITEARGYRVDRISPTRTFAAVNVPAQQILKIPMGVGEINFSAGVNRWPQGGMEGLVIHPDFKTNPAKQWVYIAYVYKQESCPNGTDGTHPNGFPCFFRSKIIRCRFYYRTDAGNPSLRTPKADTLTIMDTVISNLAGSNDHNSGRLAIKPQLEAPSNTYKLYYTIGDMGAGQFNNDTRTNNAQNLDVVEGKILRLNTEPDADVVDANDPNNKWIPNDNPFTFSGAVVPATLSGKRSPIFTYGHRNAQGLSWGSVDGGVTYKLYSSEHGDKSDDEVNLLQAGLNYGWPRVAGMSDTNYSSTDAFANNNLLANISVSWNEGQQAGMQRPLFSTFNWPASTIPSSGANIFTWPTIAPSSIEFYKGNIPGWKYSLLVTSLKYGMYRLKLKSTGDYVDSTITTNTVDTFPLLHSWRVRDIAQDPAANSGTFWVILDSTGSTSGPTGGFTGGNVATKSGGKVLKLTYKVGMLTLPVDFISFNGKLLMDKTIRLDWKAETDVHHNYFDVEKSTNNFTFSSIGRVTTKPPYFLVDPSPNIGNNYYRIKQLDLDGKYTYSKVINIVYDPSAFTMQIYPNPIKDVLNLKVSLSGADNIQLQVSDMQGQIVLKKTKFIANGIGEFNIDVRSWPSQLYSVKIIDSNNKVLGTQKIIKL